MSKCDMSPMAEERRVQHDDSERERSRSSDRYHQDALVDGYEGLEVREDGSYLGLGQHLPLANGRQEGLNRHPHVGEVRLLGLDELEHDLLSLQLLGRDRHENARRYHVRETGRRSHGRATTHAVSREARPIGRRRHGEGRHASEQTRVAEAYKRASRGEEENERGGRAKATRVNGGVHSLGSNTKSKVCQVAATPPAVSVTRCGV